MADIKNESPAAERPSGDQKQPPVRGDRPRQNTGRRRSFHKNTPQEGFQPRQKQEGTETSESASDSGRDWPRPERPNPQNREPGAALHVNQPQNGTPRMQNRGNRRRPGPPPPNAAVRGLRDSQQQEMQAPREEMEPEETRSPSQLSPISPVPPRRPAQPRPAAPQFRTETVPMPKEIMEQNASASSDAPLPAADTKTPVEIVGVRFKPAGKVYYFDPAGAVYKEEDPVIVETVRGIEYGFVVTPNRTVMASDIVSPLKVILRRATEEDSLHYEENNRRRDEAFRICQQKIAEHRIDMKLVDVEYTFDNNKLLFYFTADGRVDFRELVKDLASVFRTRIELRQIGIRDEAKLKGGLGVCGRPFCCHSFLSDFVQVSIKMAKEQNLSLNSAKISGTCGRLMCCLRYEYDVYEEEIRKTPKLDAVVDTPDGEAVVCEVIPLAGLVRVKFIGNRSDVPPKLFHRDVLHVKGKMNWKSGTITYYDTAKAEEPLSGAAEDSEASAAETLPDSPVTEPVAEPQETVQKQPKSEAFEGSFSEEAPAMAEDGSECIEEPDTPNVVDTSDVPDTREVPDASDAADISDDTDCSADRE